MNRGTGAMTATCAGCCAAWARARRSRWCSWASPPRRPARELPPFGELTGAANPLSTQAVFGFSAPALGDLDRDGDLDLVSGDSAGTFSYSENSGSAVGPVFFAQTGVDNPLDGATAGARSSPALGDLDGDGDLDLLVANGSGVFSYFENTGAANSPAFIQRTGAANPLEGQPGYRPSLGDLDGDGDLDVVAGTSLSTFLYFENTGSATGPVFVQRTGTANPLDGQATAPFAQTAPALGDLDRDGDLDLVAGLGFGLLFSFENTGSATSPAFLARTGAANPFDDAQLGNDSRPSLGDLDGDGDLELVSGNDDGDFFTFENLVGRLVPRTGVDNPLDGQDVGFLSHPSLGDLDGDGDLDLVAGESYGSFRYFQNTGSAASPVFVERTGTLNPLDGQDVGFDSAPSLGDLDDDGDLDLVSRGNYGTFRYFQNTGSATSPVFVERTGAANPFGGLLGQSPAPALGDLDGDGDLDLVAGQGFGDFLYFESTGSAASPAFVQRTGAANPLDGVDVGSEASPSLGDADGDGDLDVVSGNIDGIFEYGLNVGSATSPSFGESQGTADPLLGQDVGSNSTAALGDLDGDGDLDLIAGAFDGVFHSFDSFIPQILPAFQLMGSANPLDGEDVGTRSNAALGDLDGDGDLDLVAGEQLGGFRYFANTGSATSPAFLERTGAANPLDGQNAGFYTPPSLADLDGDGDLDLVTGDSDGLGVFHYFENIGTATSPGFIERTGPASPLDGIELYSFNSAPSLGDLDGDGDLDLVAGAMTGTFFYVENTGNALSPAFVKQFGSANPLDGHTVAWDSAPSLGDFDRDGDLDLVSGSYYATLLYFQNHGTATSPSFGQLSGAANPLDGEDLGAQSLPAAGDLDGDGDLDLVTGTGAGTFAVHYFPEPARGLLLGAGIALLGWLGRLRRRA